LHRAPPTAPPWHLCPNGASFIDGRLVGGVSGVFAEAIACLERSDKLKPGVREVAVALARLRAETPRR